MELVEVDNGGSEELNFILGAPHGGGGGAGQVQAGGPPVSWLLILCLLWQVPPMFTVYLAAAAPFSL